MKQVILIDGENLIHKILRVLEEAKLATDREVLVGFDIRELLKKTLGEKLGDDAEINYYTTKVHLVDAPDYLAKKTQNMIEWNSRFVPELNRQGISYVKAGNLQVRDGKRCQKCGHQNHVLQEKGVDVRIATDLLLAAEEGNEVVLVSSDSDIIPAVNAAQDKGADLTYIGFDSFSNDGLRLASDSTYLVAKEHIVETFKEINHG